MENGEWRIADAFVETGFQSMKMHQAADENLLSETLRERAEVSSC
jgi:hypothetical protein